MSDAHLENLPLLEEGNRIVEGARDHGLVVRLLGGAAVVHHSHTSPSHRKLGDLDVVVGKRSARSFAQFVRTIGYEAEQRFNALHGDRRMIFYGPVAHLDVLVGAFEMCHVIELEPRLELDFPTITVTDLLLSKLQVVELNEKDALDISVIMRDHAVEDSEGDVISVSRLHQVVRGDWGLWRTSLGTLAKLEAFVKHAEVLARIQDVRAALENAPTSLAFRMRALVGERKRWYEIPDDAPT